MIMDTWLAKSLVGIVLAQLAMGYGMGYVDGRESLRRAFKTNTGRKPRVVCEDFACDKFKEPQ